MWHDMQPTLELAETATTRIREEGSEASKELIGQFYQFSAFGRPPNIGRQPSEKTRFFREQKKI
jgi:hypothetical protein